MSRVISVFLMVVGMLFCSILQFCGAQELPVEGVTFDNSSPSGKAVSREVEEPPVLRALDDPLAPLRRQLAEKQASITDLQEENRQLKERMYELDMELARVQVDQTPLREQVARLQNRIRELFRQKKSLGREVEELQAQSKAYQISFDQLKEARSRGGERSYGQLGILLQEREERLVALGEEKSALETELQEYRRRSIEGARDYQTLREEFLRQQEQMETLQEQLRALEAQYDDSRQGLDSREASLLQRDAVIAQMQGLIDAKDAQIEEVAEENASLSQMASELQEFAAQMERERKDMEYRFSQQQQRLSRHDEIVGGFQDEKTRLVSDTKELRAVNSLQQDELKKVRLQIEEKERLIAELKKDNTQMKERLSSQEKAVLEFRLQSRGFEEGSRRQEEALQKLEQEAARLKADKNALFDEKEALRIQLQELSRQLTEARLRSEERQQGQQIREGTLRERERQIEALEAQKEMLQKDIAESKNRFELLKTDHRNLNDQYMKQSSEFEALQRKIMGLEHENKRLLGNDHLMQEAMRQNDKKAIQALALLDVKQKEVDNLIRLRQEKEAAINQLNRRVQELERSVHESRQDVQRAQLDNSRLEGSIEEFTRLKKERSELLLQVQELGALSGVREKRIIEMTAEFKETKRDLARLEEAARDKQGSIVELEQKVGALEETLSRSRDLLRVEQGKAALSAAAITEKQQMITSLEQAVRGKDSMAADLSARIERITTELQTAQKESQQAKVENVRLQSQLEAYKAQVEKYAQELASIRQDQSLLKKEYEALKSSSVDYEKSFDRSSALLEEKEQSLTRLERLLEEREASIGELTDTIKEQEKALLKKQKEVEQAKVEVAQLDKYTESIAALKEERTELNKRNEELKALIKEREKAVIEAQAVVGQKDGVISELRASLSSYDEKRALLDSQREQLEGRLKDAQTALGRLKVENAELTGKLHEQVAQTEEYARKVMRTEEEAKRRESEKASAFMKLTVAVQEKEQALLELKDDQQALRKRLHNYTTLLAKGRDAYERIRRELSEAQEVILSHKEQMQNLKDGFTDELYQLQSKHDARRQDVTAMQAENAGLKQEVALLQDEKEQLSRRITEVHSAREAIEGEISQLGSLQEEYNALQREYEELVRSNRQSREEALRIKQEAVLKDEQISALNRGATQQQGVREARQVRENALQDQIKGLKARVEELTFRVQDKERVISDLMKQLESSTQEVQATRESLQARPSPDAFSYDDLSVLSAMDVKSFSVHHTLGVLYLKRNQFQDAAREFERALELRPDDASVYYNLGLIYAVHFDDMPKAIEYFNKYLEFAPEDKKADDVRRYINIWKLSNPDPVGRAIIR